VASLGAGRNPQDSQQLLGEKLVLFTKGGTQNAGGKMVENTIVGWQKSWTNHQNYHFLLRGRDRDI